MLLRCAWVDWNQRIERKTSAELNDSKHAVDGDHESKERMMMMMLALKRSTTSKVIRCVRCNKIETNCNHKMS